MHKILSLTGKDLKPSWHDPVTHEPNTSCNPDGTATGTMIYPSLTYVSDNNALPLADEYYATVFVRPNKDLLGLDYFWNQGGKLPGLANTGQAMNSGGSPVYGRPDGSHYHPQKTYTAGAPTVTAPPLPGEIVASNAGWGGRSANGCRWSARTASRMNPNKTWVLGTYGYGIRHTHPLDKNDWNKSDWGQCDHFGPSEIAFGTWVAYVERVKLNTPGQQDGVLEYWVVLPGHEPVKAYSNKAIRWRAHDHPLAKISEAWVDMYCGGTKAMADPHAPWPRTSMDFAEMLVTDALPDLGQVKARLEALAHKP